MSKFFTKTFKATRKFLKVASLVGMVLLVRVVVNGVLEYLLCYGTSVVVSDTLLHGKLNQPVAALGLLVAGIWFRYFTKSGSFKAQQASAGIKVRPVTPADVAALNAALDSLLGRADSAPAEPKASPYL